MNRIKSLLCVSLCMTMLLGIGSHTAVAAPEPLYTAGKETDMKNDKTKNTAVYTDALYDLGLSLLAQGEKEKTSAVLSPLSIYTLLGMLANGAANETQAEIEAVLQGGTDDVNQYLSALQLSDAAGGRLKQANAMWFNNRGDFVAQKPFISTVRDKYKASLYRQKFSAATIQRINQWVNQQTDRQISDILPEMSDAEAREIVTFLVQTITFDAKWAEPYKGDAVREQNFININEEARPVNMMTGSEYAYISTDTATGFIKPYANNAYSFVALLPNPEIDVFTYLNHLDGETVQRLIADAADTLVLTAIPQFVEETDMDLTQTLPKLGITEAFDEREADFSRLGKMKQKDWNLYLQIAKHSARITVDAEGTKAAAASVGGIGIARGAVPTAPKVYLNRPFVYLIVETATNVPVFMGIVTDITHS